MNREVYAVTCTKCDSTDVEFEYDKATFNTQLKETKTPVRCNSCGYETNITIGLTGFTLLNKSF